MDDTMGRKKLFDYLPPIMQNFSEIKQITKTEQIEMDLLNGEIRKIWNNAFIESCDEYSIMKYEKLVGVASTAHDTLDLRKSRVQIHWNSFVPYSYRAVIRSLNVFCGVNNYEISGDLKNYELTISTHLSIAGQTEELERMLDKILPVPIVLTVFNKLEYKLAASVCLHGVTIKSKTVTINS